MARPVRRGTSAVLAAVVGGLVLAGCGGGEPASPFPPRPVDIDVSTLDPCSTLTRDQQDVLGVGPGEVRVLTLPSGPSRACMWSNVDDGFNYTVQVIDESATAAVGAPGTSVDTVGGFGAVRVTDFAGSAPLCELYVDSADDRSIRVQVQATADDPDGSAKPLEKVCAVTSSVASQVMGNIRNGAR
ncbi:DUF3558 domain-containing protein [Pseudonocardia sp. C8]|uniref:DUF3558 family protein n=1 Tax=Pseudonocardia sp. C8 TaxID=2762759 RepID=UPI0016429940|nr:DUF3558 domain-containing protein [Pseudonocardia sp. C8]